MEITTKTTVAELIMLASEVPAIMNMNIGGLALMANSVKQRTDGLSDRMTLSEFFERWYLPVISQRNRQKNNTIKELKTSIKYWENLTGDPQLAEINNLTVDQFVAGLYKKQDAKGKTLSDQTVKKHIGAIAGVMAYAGPKNNQYKRATGLMQELPEFPTIKKRADVNSRTPTMDQFAKILKACRAATRPILPDITPAEWFACAYLFLYATGIRRGDLFNCRWSYIKKIQDVHVLVIPSENEKTHRERIVPLNKLAIETLQKMPRDGSDELIFQWDVKNINRSLSQQRQKIAQDAGLDPILCTFHAIRRLTATMLDPAVAANVLGNNPLTCRQHYQTVAVAARAVAALPLPNISDI